MATKKKSGWSKQRLAKFRNTLASKKTSEEIRRVADILPTIKPPNLINRPAHYTSGKIEVIDFIEDQELGMHLGSSVKYIARAGKKTHPSMTTKESMIQDLQKARWYLDRKITKLESHE